MLILYRVGNIHIEKKTIYRHVINKRRKKTMNKKRKLHKLRLKFIFFNRK